MCRRCNGGILLMVNDFAARVLARLNKDEFEKVASKHIKDIFGEPCASSIMYHLGDPSVFKDPSLFETKIQAMFGIGADLILTKILDDVEKPKKHAKPTKKKEAP